MKKTKVAICYDFDGTLSPGNMQEYDFMKKISLDIPTFWKKSTQLMNDTNSDGVLAYMRLMIEESVKKNLPFTRQDFKEYGKNLPLYPGVKTWFDRINAYGALHNIKIEHYIISSGLREMILGHPIAKKFKHIYASSFMYDEKGNAVWPAMALNYTTKTQYLFRINKGCLDINDPEINAYVPDELRPIPLSNMIYIGDGMTDVPCMRLVKRENGHSIAVFNDDNPKSKNAAKQLFKEGRVNFIAKADYTSGALMEKIVQTILDKINADTQIDRLKKECKVSK